MRFLKTVKIINLSLILLFFSCKSSFYTEKINQAEGEKQGIIYALPKVKLIVTAEISKEIRQKGIFANYTHLYFNAKNSILKNEIRYYISDISVNTIPIIDSSKIYRIISPENINPLLINLSKENFISGINLSDIQAGKVNTEQNRIHNQEINTNGSDYADISLHSVREVQYDTIYKEVLRDSVMIKVPIIQKKEVYKSKAKQAKETAATIFNLRDDRYALLTGENDGNNFPDGEAVKQMLKELNVLEKKYMSLFTGRELKIKKTYKFEFIPGSKSEKISDTMFYFSKKSGITQDTTDNPVILHFTDSDTRISELKFKEKYEGILYRIPEKAELTVTLCDKELYKTELEIPQTGTLNLIPSSLFNSKVTVEFYPELGALKRISEKE